MKYRHLPCRAKFRKGTSRRKRRVLGKIFDNIVAQAAPMMEAAQLHALIHGEAQLRVSWDADENVRLDIDEGVR